MYLPAAVSLETPGTAQAGEVERDGRRGPCDGKVVALLYASARADSE
jgi:hypothetical protein